MKRILLSMITLLCFSSFAQASDLVDDYYCKRLKRDAKTTLRLLVDNAQISLKKANLRYTLIHNTCASAIDRGLSISQYRVIFDPVTLRDCDNIPNDLEQVMRSYDQGSIDYVAQKMDKMCQSAVDNGNNRLDLMVENQSLLKKLNIIK